MDKKLIIRQNGFKDCGPSCLLSIMKYYGCEASHEEVTYILKTDIDGTNAYNIINGARSFGFDGYGIHYTYENIINREISFPIICHVLKNGMYHFIVIYGVKKDYLIVMDPSSDITKLSIEEFKKIYLNTSIVIYPVKKFEKINNHKSLFNFISDYIKLEKNSAIKIIILSLITLFIATIGNYYMLICIDLILPNYRFDFLVIVSILFLISYFIKNIFDYYKNKYIFNIEMNISIKLNNDVIRKYFNLPYQFFKNKSTGESISRLNDLKIFKDILSSIVLNVSTNIILVIISLFILLTINIKLFLLTCLELGLYYLTVVIFKSSFNKKSEDVLINEGNYNKTLNESINGYEINKNLNLNDETIKKIEINYIIFLNKIKLYQESINKQLMLKNSINGVFNILYVFVSVIFISKNIISLGEFVLFNSIMYYFKEPFKEIMDLFPNVNYIKNIYNRINDLLIIKSNSYEFSKKKIKEDIRIENLSYSYDGINNIFENVNINIKYGSKFLIYSNSGYGKSTIIKILLKYFEDYKGKVYIGSINLKDIAPSIISDNMTYVSQNSFIENDTLMNNIIYGRKVSEEEYERVLDVCNLKKLRDSKLMRNNFIIEDNGFNISGGERQKVVLARSILKDCNYLILDEALSEVDLEEEIEILNKIFDIFKDKTVICISHKKEMINMFNLKYKLERSEVLC